MRSPLEIVADAVLTFALAWLLLELAETLRAHVDVEGGYREYLGSRAGRFDQFYAARDRERRRESDAGAGAGGAARLRDVSGETVGGS